MLIPLNSHISFASTLYKLKLLKKGGKKGPT